MPPLCCPFLRRGPGFKKSRKSKRNSHRSGSQERSNTKQITEPSHPPAPHNDPHMVSGNVQGGVGFSSSFFHFDTSTLLPRLSSSGITALPLNSLQDDFFSKANRQCGDLSDHRPVKSRGTLAQSQYETNLNVVNLSSHKITDLETQVLVRGSQFFVQTRISTNLRSLKISNSSHKNFKTTLFQIFTK